MFQLFSSHNLTSPWFIFLRWYHIFSMTAFRWQALFWSLVCILIHSSFFCAFRCKLFQICIFLFFILSSILGWKMFKETDWHSNHCCVPSKVLHLGHWRTRKAVLDGFLAFGPSRIILAGNSYTIGSLQQPKQAASHVSTLQHDNPTLPPGYRLAWRVHSLGPTGPRDSSNSVSLLLFRNRLCWLHWVGFGSFGPSDSKHLTSLWCGHSSKYCSRSGLIIWVGIVLRVYQAD